ncbi:MBL fold metallo-hydrolase [Paenarthrobacter aurescens]|uniref:MBL fold metallo-hydrolase n=1 Tax=Paenarthrobacter aurescens TaxID=43663 RepID=UPI0021C1590C|nr:MBL fold metallo-hydrolase [Paenarthrobacter aurescens]MCT9870338.1 MBL fold metallo-hydrolase [Paenarthrobacter aurescens]
MATAGNSPSDGDSSLQRSSDLTRFRLAPNPGPMSLDGTNSYVIGEPASGHVAVVDPGPEDEQHLTVLAAAGVVDVVLITHRHADHTEASARFHELSGAPVRAVLPEHCHGGEPLTDGEVLMAGGVEIRVVATPGHTSDSVCFHLPGDGPHGSVLTGDTILGRGTTVLDYPDGRLGDYLASLDRLEALGPAILLPAHGPALAALDEKCREYRAHREQRLDQIRAALENLGQDAPIAAVTDAVYPDVDPSVRWAAETSVAAQLDYLRS